MGALNPYARSGPEARRDREATRAQQALLIVSTQGFTMRAPEGWPASATPRATADAAARRPFAGSRGECAAAPTWPARAKGRQPPPSALRSPPGARPAAGVCCAAFGSAGASRGAMPVRQPAPSGALRAPLKMKRGS